MSHVKSRRKKKSDTGRRKSVRERIRRIKDEIRKANEYLETGHHAHWHGFRPLFVDKVREGKICPPHKDWIRKFFIPLCERKLRDAETVECEND